VSQDLGENDYRQGGLQRLRESKVLLDGQLFAGGVYLAGRAVESLLRALIWKHDRDIKSGRRSLQTGHDLRELLKLVANLGVLKDNPLRDRMIDHVQIVARQWINNLRFFPTAKLNTWWWKIGVIRGKRTLKATAYDYYDSCSWIVKQCEALCEK